MMVSKQSLVEPGIQSRYLTPSKNARDGVCARGVTALVARPEDPDGDKDVMLVLCDFMFEHAILRLKDVAPLPDHDYADRLFLAAETLIHEVMHLIDKYEPCKSQLEQDLDSR